MGLRLKVRRLLGLLCGGGCRRRRRNGFPLSRPEPTNIKHTPHAEIEQPLQAHGSSLVLHVQHQEQVAYHEEQQPLADHEEEAEVPPPQPLADKVEGPPPEPLADHEEQVDVAAREPLTDHEEEVDLQPLISLLIMNRRLVHHHHHHKQAAPDHEEEAEGRPSEPLADHEGEVDVQLHADHEEEVGAPPPETAPDHVEEADGPPPEPLIDHEEEIDVQILQILADHEQEVGAPPPESAPDPVEEAEGAPPETLTDHEEEVDVPAPEDNIEIDGAAAEIHVDNDIDAGSPDFHAADGESDADIDEEEINGSVEEEPTMYCTICMESKPLEEMFFMISFCSHSFCNACIGTYIVSTVEDNSVSIRCPDPGCKHGLLEPEWCRTVVTLEVIDRWEQILCEQVIGSKFYCPFRDCSALLTDEQKGVGAAITVAECPHCHRLFCAECRIPWHADVTCGEFQKLGADERGREDVMVMNMAKAQKWQRCPKCKFYVERTEGCLFIKCRCGHAFCYNCASPMGENHNCLKCKR